VATTRSGGGDDAHVHRCPSDRSGPEDHGRPARHGRRGDSLRSVAQELVADEVGAALIEGPAGPIGLISERDVVTVAATGGDLDNDQAADVMTTDLVTADPDDSIASVARLMLEAGVRHVVMLREGEAVAGLVSIRDVLAVVVGEH
jgi:CBS domain-containing protein